MEENEDQDDDLYNDDFRHGMDVGRSLGFYEASEEARVAYEAGEFEFWLDLQRPKTMEEWDAWEAEHGETSTFKDRWKRG